MLISKTERRPALYNRSVTEYSNKGLKDRLWGEVCEAVVSECSQLDSPEKHEKVNSVVFNIINTNEQVYINVVKYKDVNRKREIDPN
jgi:hypothetical protein